MRKQRLRKAVTIFTVITIVITIISIGFNFVLPKYLAYKLNNEVDKVSSIGIIGGADGPTAIFLASGQSSYFFTVIFLLLTIGGVLYLISITEILDNKSGKRGE